MNAGDVMLLEAQTAIGNSDVMLPVEVYPAEFDAIAAATRKGIIVIEAAGNGGADLDKTKDAQGLFSLNRKSPDFKDSGAIMIGAASSTHPHSAPVVLEPWQPHRLLRLGRECHHDEPGWLL